MKNESTPRAKAHLQSAFFNLRVLIGLFMALAGVFLALVGFGVFSPVSTAQAQQKYHPAQFGKSVDPLVPAMFDCSKIHQLGIDRQENFRAGAIMIYCGEAQGGTASPGDTASRLVEKLLSPLTYGAADVDLITGTETYPNVTQSETFTAINPDNPLQIVIAYNDSRGRNFNPINISGASCSTDGGITFTRITGTNGQSPFSGTAGDPVILYRRTNATWYTVWLDLGCSGQGLGGFSSSNPCDPTSWHHFCVDGEGSADRESGWVDNNSSSPFYGNMYVSWNDFAVGGGALVVTVSTDGGSTFTRHQLTSGNPFIRNVQITGDLATGDVYIAGMNEGGGGLAGPRSNLIYRSTDGGATWTNTYTGPTFSGPGSGLCSSSSYFASMFGGYWRHMGWGEPAAFNHVVHYVYAQHGTGSDPGDVYYIRSTDSGVTFSAPLKLNTDATTTAQWQPNLSVSPAGTLFATWYDGREGTGCSPGVNTPCYRMWGRKSNDNGVTWMPDMPFSDVVSPLPAQPDPGIVGCYAGDYDYQKGEATSHRTAWVDGRVAVNNVQQQDPFTDRELVGFSVVSPACGSFITGTAPTEFVVNLNEPVDPATVNASDFTVNGTPADSFFLSNGNQTITFHYNTSPAVQGQNTMHIPYCAFRSANGECVLEYLCMFRYGQTQLQVTTTVPPVGGTFSPPAPGTYTYDVNWNMAVNPASVSTSSLTLSGNTGATVTNVQVINGNTTTRFTLNIQYGGSLTVNIAAGAITDQFGNPSAAFSGNYTVLGCPPPQYVVAQGTDAITPGTTDSGNHCNDCITNITLPFSFQLYGNTYTAVHVSSNGNAQFVSSDPSFVPVCLPWASRDFTIFPLWEHLRTDLGLSGCAGYLNGQCGIFYSTTGSPPNRIFNIEWRAVLYSNNASRNNFELRVYENDLNKRFDIVFGEVNTTGASLQYVSGVQGNGGGGFFTQDFCGSNPPHNVSRSYTVPPCAPQAQDALSRKVHGAAGTFDIPLPLTGNVGIECRSGGATNDYQMIINFATTVTVGSASVTSGTGSVSSFTVSGPQVTVNLTGVTNAQRITVTLMNVNDGTHMGNVPVSMGVLIGDVNGNAVVNASDVSLTKSQVGQAVTGSNFREDVNANGLINSVDVALVKSKVGTALPP